MHDYDQSQSVLIMIVTVRPNHDYDEPRTGEIMILVHFDYCLLVESQTWAARHEIKRSSPLCAAISRAPSRTTSSAPLHYPVFRSSMPRTCRPAPCKKPEPRGARFDWADCDVTPWRGRGYRGEARLNTILCLYYLRALRNCQFTASHT